MRIVIAADHAGFTLKEEMVRTLRAGLDIIIMRPSAGYPNVTTIAQRPI